MYIYKVVITEKPSEDSEYYCLEVQSSPYHHFYEGWEVLPSEPIFIHGSLRVNSITGECTGPRDIIGGKG